MGFLDTIVATWKTGAISMYNSVRDFFNAHPEAWNVAVVSPVLLPVKLAIEGINLLKDSDVDTPDKVAGIQSDMDSVNITLNNLLQTQSDVASKPYNDLYSQYGGHPFIYVDPSPSGHVGNIFFTSAGSTLLDTRIANGGFMQGDTFVTSRDQFFATVVRLNSLGRFADEGFRFGAPPVPPGDGASSPVPPLDLSAAPAPAPEPEPVPEPPQSFVDKIVSNLISAAIPNWIIPTDSIKSSLKNLAVGSGLPENQGLRILGALNPVSEAAQFGDFILEEAMQASSFAVSNLIREKEYASAQLLLDQLVLLWKAAKKYRDDFGVFNTTTGDVFELNLQAMASSILAYQEILKDKLPRPLNVPDEFDAICREITDGDTINVIYNGHKFPVRLVGLNSPESGEPYYTDSKRALFRFIWGAQVRVRCDPANKFDNYGRLLADVVKDGVSVNLSMVRQGWAFYYPLQAHKYIYDSTYDEADSLARTEKRGIWGLINRANLAAPQGAIPVKSARTAIKVSSLPSHATIFLDGEYTYKLTAETIDVTPGPHVVEVREFGYANQSATIDVPDGAVVEAHFKLQKL